MHKNKNYAGAGLHKPLSFDGGSTRYARATKKVLVRCCARLKVSCHTVCFAARGKMPRDRVLDHLEKHCAVAGRPDLELVQQLHCPTYCIHFVGCIAVTTKTSKQNEKNENEQKRAKKISERTNMCQKIKRDEKSESRARVGARKNNNEEGTSTYSTRGCEWKLERNLLTRPRG